MILKMDDQRNNAAPQPDHSLQGFILLMRAESAVSISFSLLISSLPLPTLHPPSPLLTLSPCFRHVSS